MAASYRNRLYMAKGYPSESDSGDIDRAPGQGDHLVDVGAAGEQVVEFHEGRINRTDEPIRLRQGLVRLAQLSKTNGVPVSVVPVGIAYSEASPPASSRAAICFEAPFLAEGTGREAAAHMSQQLADRMHTAEQAARQAVGRPLRSH